MKHRCRLCSVVVITPDSESGDPSSTLGTASIFPGHFKAVHACSLMDCLSLSTVHPSWSGWQANYLHAL